MTFNLKFNLADHLGIAKEAMGAVHWKNRQNPLETWSLEKIEDYAEGSQDPDVIRWAEWVDAVPGLKDLIPLAQDKRQKYLQKISSYYGMSPESANKILRLFIAYEPMSGPYILFTGPYVSDGMWHGPEHIRTPANGKFIASTLSVAPNSIRGCQKALEGRIKKLQASYESTGQGEGTGINFDSGDFTLVEMGIPHINEEGVEVEGVENTINGASISQLEPEIPNPRNSPEIDEQNEQIRQRNLESNPQVAGNEFFGEDHVTAKKEWRLNKNGYEKIMKSLMSPFYEKAVSDRAASLVNSGASPEDARQMVVEEYSRNGKSLSEFYEQVRKSRVAAKKDPSNPLHTEVMSKVGLGYPEPPSFKAVHTSTFGQVVPREVRPPDDARNIYDFRKKIVDLIRSGISDVDEIEQVINAGLSDKYKTPTTKISSEINKIADMRGVLISEGKQGTYEEIIERIDQTLGELTSYGYRDMQMAVDMMEAYLTTQGGPPNLEIVDKNDMQLKTIPNIVEEDVGEQEEALTDEELEMQLGDGEEEEVPQIEEEGLMPQQERVEVDTEEPQPQATPQPQTPMPTPLRRQAPQPTLPDDEEDDQEIESLLDLIGNTLRGLIKVAKELDSEGKGDAAEEVHKVIRKYQKRII